MTVFLGIAFAVIACASGAEAGRQFRLAQKATLEACGSTPSTSVDAAELLVRAFTVAAFECLGVCVLALGGLTYLVALTAH